MNHGKDAMTYRIVLADDQPMVRKYVRGILSEKEDFEVVGEAGDGRDLIDVVDHCEVVPDLVIVDISMPNMTGLDAIESILARHPEVCALVLTVHKDEAYVTRAIEAGASGFMIKGNADTELIPAIQKIRQGSMYWPSWHERT
jgi:two-component system, NarL family, response regulator NreC